MADVGRPVRTSRVIMDYSVVNRKGLEGDPMDNRGNNDKIVQPKHKANTPWKLSSNNKSSKRSKGVKAGKGLKVVKSTNGNWSVTPGVRGRVSRSDSPGASPIFDTVGMNVNDNDNFLDPVAEDGEIVDLHPDDQEFDDEVTFKQGGDISALEREVLEMERELEQKKLKALRRRKEKL